MADFIVTSTADDGAGSLRKAIADAASGDTIVFDDALEEGGVITILLSSQLNIGAKEITIDGGSHTGSGATLATRVILDGQNATYLLNYGYAAGAFTKTFKNLTFQNGSRATGSGGALYNERADITGIFEYCVFKNNTSPNHGGVIFAYGMNSNVFKSCLFSGNTATGYTGGAIYISYNSTATIDDCFFINNSARTYGADVSFFTNSGGGSIKNSSFTSNTNVSNVWIATPNPVVIQGFNTASSITIANGASITFSGVDSVLAVTSSATIGTSTFTAAADSTGYAAFPANTDTSAATFTGVKTAIYSTSTPTVSASIGETRTATVTIANADPGYIAEVVYADGVVADITIDDGSAVIAVDKAFKIRVFNGAFYESAQVARTYYLKVYDTDGDFAVASDWTIDAAKTLTANTAPTISGGTFYCTQVD